VGQRFQDSQAKTKRMGKIESAGSGYSRGRQSRQDRICACSKEIEGAQDYVIVLSETLNLNVKDQIRT
jgi:hypothetical protein